MNQQLLNAQHLCEAAQKTAKQLQLDGIELAFSLQSGYSLEVRKQQLDDLSYHHNQHVVITVYKDQCKGNVSGCQLTPAAIEQLVAKAADIAKFTQPDPAAGLAPTDLLCRKAKDLALHHPHHIEIETAVEQIKALEQAALAIDPRVKQVEQAWLGMNQGEQCYFNSAMDAPLKQAKTHFSQGVSVIAEAEKQMEQAYEYSVVRDFSDLTGIEQLAQKAVAKATGKLGAKSLTNQSAPVILAPAAAKTLWRILLSAISGRAIYQKTSFLTDALGKTILPTGFSVHQDPFIAKAIGSASFDDDGVQTQAMDFIKHGVLEHFILSQYSANRLGMQTTGNSGNVFNISPQGPSASFHNMLQQMDTGLLVTDFMGQGVDLSTGSFSKAINGFWVENGQIQFPVHHTSIAGHLPDMLQRIVLLGNDDIDTKTTIRTGSVLLEQMNISGMAHQ